MVLSKNLDIKRMLIFLAYLHFFLVGKIWGQCDEIEQLQPTIMVIPNVLVDKDILSKIQNDENYSNAISAIDKAFLDKDFQTENFIQHFKDALSKDFSLMDKYTAEEAVNKAIENSTAQFFVKAVISIEMGSIGKYVKIKLEAVDQQSSGRNFAVLPYCKSQQSKVADISELIEEALNSGENGIDYFLNEMSKNLQKIKRKGLMLSVDLTIGEDAEIDLSEEMDDDYNSLSDLIREWVKENAIDNSIAGNSETLLNFSEIRIPFFTEKCKKNDANSFGSTMRKGLNKILGNNTNISPHRFKESIYGNKIIFILKKRK